MTPPRRRHRPGSGRAPAPPRAEGGNGVLRGRRGTRTASGARQHRQPRQQLQARHL